MDLLLLLRGLAALIFTLSLIGGFALLAKRFGWLQQSRPGKQMQVVETCALDPRHRLVLFRVGETHRVALIGPNSCQFLNEEIEVSAEPDAMEDAPNNVIGWQAVLQKAWATGKHGVGVKRAAR